MDFRHHQEGGSKKLAALLKKKDDGQLAEKDTTVFTLLDDYLENAVRHTTDQATWRTVSVPTTSSSPLLGKVRLGKLTAETVQQLLSALEEKATAPT